MKRMAMSIWLVPAIVLASALGSQSFAGVNLLANPGFEANGGSYQGWTTFGNGPQISLPETDNISRTGIAAAKIFGEFTGCPNNPTFSVGGFFQSFTPAPGMEYELSGYSYMSSEDPIPGTDTCNRNRLIAKIVFFNAPSGGSEISSNEVIIGDGDTPLDQWLGFSVSAPVPTGAQRVQAMFLFLQPGCDTGSVFVDDCSFYGITPTVEPNVLANPSFSTNLSGWTTFGNVYHDSRSFAVRTPTGSAKMFSTFTPGSDSGMYQTFAAAPGDIWKLDAHVMTTCVENPITTGNDNYVLGRVVFLDAGSAEIGAGESVILDATAPLGTWTKHTVIAEAPAGTASVAAYFLFISPSLAGGAVWIDDVSLYETGWAGVPSAGLTADFKLYPNVPNPFSLSTRIDFEIAKRGEVDVIVYDVAGRRVATLHSAELEAGPHTVAWDGKTADGRPAASGIYWYVLRTPAGRTSRSMVLLK